MKKETPRSAFYMGLEAFSNRLDGYAKGRFCGSKEIGDLQNIIVQYLQGSYDAEKKQEASSHFLWSIKKVMSSSLFGNKAVNLLQYSYKRMKLADSEKQKFFDIMLGVADKDKKNPNYFLQFSKECYTFFADYKIKDAAQQLKNDKMFNKVETTLSHTGMEANDYFECAQRLYPFLSTYSANAQNVDSKLISRYTNVLFNIQNNCAPHNVPFWPVCNLLTRSDELKQNPQMQSLFGDGRPSIDKKAVSGILNDYIGFINQNDKVSSSLHIKVGQMMSYIVQNYDYKPAEVMALRKQLGMANVTRPTKRYLLEMGQNIVSDYAKSLPVNTPKSYVNSQVATQFQRER